MNKTAIIVAILLYSISSSQMVEGGWVEFPDYDYNIRKETGKIVFKRELNKDTKDVVLNGEVVAEIDARKAYIFASSLKNGQLTLAVKKYMHDEGGLYTIMYTIDVKSKTVIKEERLNTIYTYKDSDLKFSVIGDEEAPVMQYTWKGKTHKVIFPEKVSRDQIFDSYVTGNGYIVFNRSNQVLYVFSMDKKKFIELGRFNVSCDCKIKNFYIPFNEYVIYFPLYSSQVFLYNYAEDASYITRYQNIDNKTKDTIFSNIRNGNTYEQFLPITRVENIDSMVNANSLKSQTDYWRKK